MTKGTSRGALVCWALVTAACGAGDNTVDPGDLGLRDLLGLSPDVAVGWTAAQRGSARRILINALRAPAEGAFGAPADDALRAPAEGALGAGAAASDARAARSDDAALVALAALDEERARAGREPLGVVRVHVALGTAVEISPRTGAAAADVLAADSVRGEAVLDPARGAGLEGETGSHVARAALEPSLALGDAWHVDASWAQLPDRGLGVLGALARDTRSADPGAVAAPVVVVPAPQMSAIAAYIAHDGAAAHLAVNPVLLAAIDPAVGEGGSAVSAAAPARAPAAQAASSSRALLQRAASSRPEIPSTSGPVEALPSGNPYSFYGSFEECAAAQRTRCESCLAGSGDCTPVTDATNGRDECTTLADNAGRGYFLLCVDLSLSIGSVERCTRSKDADCSPSSGAADHLSTLELNQQFLDTPACAGALDACLAQVYGAPDQPFPGLDGGSEPPDPPRTTHVTCGNACNDNNANCSLSPNVDCGGASCNNTASCDCDNDNDKSGSCDSSSGSGTSGCNSSSGSSNSGCSGCDSGSNGCSGCSNGSGGSNGGCNNGKCNVAPGAPGPAVALASLLWALLPVPVAARLRRRRRGPRPGGSSKPCVPGPWRDLAESDVSGLSGCSAELDVSGLSGDSAESDVSGLSGDSAESCVSATPGTSGDCEATRVSGDAAAPAAREELRS